MIWRVAVICILFHFVYHTDFPELRKELIKVVTSNICDCTCENGTCITINGELIKA
jgi:hypothetical protein